VPQSRAQPRRGPGPLVPTEGIGTGAMGPILSGPARRGRGLPLQPRADDRRRGRANRLEPEVDQPVNRLRRGSDPRIVAAVALVIAVAAIALEIAYVVGRFAMDTVQKIP